MSDILKNNLDLIKKDNPNLVKKILNVKESARTIELKTNLAGEYNLYIDGIAVHSISNAQKEANEILKNLPHNSNISIHVIYGLGLGYLLDEFSQNASGTIIVFEDDIELLRIVLEIVDFSEIFKRKNIYITSDYKEFREALDKSFRYRAKLSISTLDYYYFQTKEKYENFSKEVKRLFVMLDHNYAFQVNQIYAFLKFTILKLYTKVKSPLINSYENYLKNKPAIIVSAGPSLSKNIDVLKKYKDNAYIFCVGTALKTLLKNGITPDFLHVIEKSNTTVHFNVPETKDMILVCEPYTHYTVFDYPFKNIIMTAAEETDSSRWFLDILGEKLINFETKGTVSYHALYTAKFLGCNPIILIGQDLAYSDGHCYAKGSAFEDLECVFDESIQKYKIVPKDFEGYKNAYYSPLNISDEEKTEKLNAALEKFNSELVTVRGQNGEMLPTSAAYSLFIEYIKEFGLKFNKDYKLINSSQGGAQIDGFENTSLKTALNQYAQTLIDKSEIAKDKFTVNRDLKSIIKKLKKEIESIQEITPFFIKGKEYIDIVGKELEKHNKYTKTAALNMQKASALYVNVTNNFTAHKRILRMVTMKEHCDITYLMKTNTLGENLDLKSAKAFYEAFKEFFFYCHDKFTWITCYLEITIKNLESSQNESSNTKS